MATNLTELLSLSKTQRNRLTKEQILELLDKTDNTGDNHILVASIATLTSEISQMRQEITEGNKEKDKKITDLEEKVSKLNETVIKQQLYLEQVDRRERERNIVLLGVPDDNEALDGATEDIEKIKKVWSAAGITCDIKSARRLGTHTSGRKRPIIAVVDSKLVRDSALDKAKNLKSCGDMYNRIYVKKDVHPSVRAEWKRLHEVAKREKDNPNNSGCNIFLNIKDRKVYKDNAVIDQWSMQSF